MQQMIILLKHLFNGALKRIFLIRRLGPNLSVITSQGFVMSKTEVEAKNLWLADGFEPTVDEPYRSPQGSSPRNNILIKEFPSRPCVRILRDSHMSVHQCQTKRLVPQWQEGGFGQHSWHHWCSVSGSGVPEGATRPTVVSVCGAVSQQKSVPGRLPNTHAVKLLAKNVVDTSYCDLDEHAVLSSLVKSWLALAPNRFPSGVQASSLPIWPHFRCVYSARVMCIYRTVYSFVVGVWLDCTKAAGPWTWFM